MFFKPKITILNGGKKEAWEAGFNARHGFTGIKIWKDIDCMGAVLAQEVCEWRYLRVMGLLAYLPISLAGFLITPSLLVGIAFMLVMLLFGAMSGARIIPGLTRRMEAKGHMVEALVAIEYYGKDESYIDLEASVLPKYDQFKGWSQERCKQMMLDEREYAEKFINKHRKWIEEQINL